MSEELVECVRLCVEEVGELFEEECVEDCRELIEG